MINFDVTGYQAPGINEVGIYTDNVNTALTQFLRILVDEYLTYGRRDTRCGYGKGKRSRMHYVCVIWMIKNQNHSQINFIFCPNIYRLL